ncbi:MAG TPA: DUF4446 family protein [Candidatus Limnocylindria bacterium]|nr:DUF4446 family protein [Candidatus Limnocylindria bacterium]
MDDLNRVLTDNLAAVLIVMAVAIVVLLVMVILQSIRVGRAVDTYRQLVRDGTGGSLDEVLQSHVARVEEVRGRLREIDAVQATLEHRTQTSIQHIGLVRFNPFEDTGSDQSFALALLDDRRDGVVISSLHGRTNTRLFAKPVEGGGSSHTLSDEEAQAIRVALGGTNADRT